MKMRKIVATSLLAIGMSSVTMLAHATHSLKIVNHTSKDSTAIINGTCSDALGDMGVTKAGKTNEVDGTIVWGACIKNLSNCKAEVFLSNHCDKDGKRIATVYFDTDKGIKQPIQYDTNEYTIIGKDFEITLEGK